eukprot:TRINITY_DN59639_c0_g1_i1.p1 TRINITY_DN59639_c0_g1~~TRINITY_DN59639_c0_g1_i1.p1  ORF type:complete len:182 (-),score=50.61 TRINITY_DN59639_c0_g1_i1:136-630(-)
MSLGVLRFGLCLTLVSVRAEDDDFDFDVEDSEFQDTPLLSSLWEATSSNDDDTINRLVDSSSLPISARSGDGRGLAWWAYEFQNVHVLASILAEGGDIESTAKDTGGETAVMMCEKNPSCNKADLIQRAQDMVEMVKKAKADRKKAEEDSDALEDDDDIGDDEF